MIELERRCCSSAGCFRAARYADVVSLGGLSAHADQRALVDYASSVRHRGPLRRVILVHGEDAARSALATELGAAGFPTVDVPSAGDRIRV